MLAYVYGRWGQPVQARATLDRCNSCTGDNRWIR